MSPSVYLAEQSKVFFFYDRRPSPYTTCIYSLHVIIIYAGACAYYNCVVIAAVRGPPRYYYDARPLVRARARVFIGLFIASSKTLFTNIVGPAGLLNLLFVPRGSYFFIYTMEINRARPLQKKKKNSETRSFFFFFSKS